MRNAMKRSRIARRAIALVLHPCNLTGPRHEGLPHEWTIWGSGMDEAVVARDVRGLLSGSRAMIRYRHHGTSAPPTRNSAVPGSPKVYRC